jgi:nitronate monooxygenase
MTWSDRRILDMFGIDVPIILAPMAGFGTVELAAGVARAGGLGSLACATLTVEQADAAVTELRKQAPGPVNVNFFCHATPIDDPAVMAAWRDKLAPYYTAARLDPMTPVSAAVRRPFDDAACAWVERVRPEVVSFHFGMPSAEHVGRVKATGARVIASATTVREAIALESRGCDAVIAQGAEAGGHRSMFLTDDVSTQVGTFALVPQVVDAVRVPVIATGGIADARGVAAALALGASAVQIGTAYLRCPEAKVSAPHRQALEHASDDATAITNVFTGRPARGFATRLVVEQGPMSTSVPPFPLAAAALAPLRAQAEAHGSGDFSNMWAGQAAKLAVAMPAFELTQQLARVR